MPIYRYIKDYLKRRVSIVYSLVQIIKLFLDSEKTIKAKFNYLLVQIQYLSKSSYLLGYPIRLTIDPSNICNLRCELCATGMRMPGRTQSYMAFATFKKIIDEIGEYIFTINLYNWGEPLLNRDIFKIIKYAREKKIIVRMSTNLNYFNDEINLNLIRSGLNELIVSLCGASQESVEKYQRGNNFELVVSNIKQLIKTKEQLKNKMPVIIWRFLVNKYNEHEIEFAKKLAQEIKIDKLEIGFLRCDTASELMLNNEEQYNSVKSWLPSNEKLSMYNYQKKEKKEIRKYCKILFTESVIQPNGSVSPCCAVWGDKFDFGNINDSSFAKIWNNHRYMEARRIIRGAKISNSEHICCICKSNKAII